MCLLGFMNFALPHNNMPDIWQRFVSGGDLGNPWLGFFLYCTHTSLRGFMNLDLLKWPTIGHNSLCYA